MSDSEAGMRYRKYINAVLPAVSAPDDAAFPLTEPDILGPFYLAGAPFQREIVPSDYHDPAAESLVITGTAYAIGADGSAYPAAGYVLDFWQADADGVYDNQGWPDPQTKPAGYMPTDYRFRGRQTVPAGGSYELTTIKPGHYYIGTDAGVKEYRTSHVHLRVWAPVAFGPGGVARELLLTTQLYFPEDVWNAQDHWYSLNRQISDTEATTGGVTSLVGTYNVVVAAAA